MELIIALLIVTWAIKYAATDLASAVRGTTPARWDRSRSKPKASKRPPFMQRGAGRRYASLLWSDALDDLAESHTKKRQKRLAEAVGDDAGDRVGEVIDGFVKRRDAGCDPVDEAFDDVPRDLPTEPPADGAPQADVVEVQAEALVPELAKAEAPAAEQPATTVSPAPVPAGPPAATEPFKPAPGFQEALERLVKCHPVGVPVDEVLTRDEFDAVPFEKRREFVDRQAELAAANTARIEAAYRTSVAYLRSLAPTDETDNELLPWQAFIAKPATEVLAYIEGKSRQLQEGAKAKPVLRLVPDLVPDDHPPHQQEENTMDDNTTSIEATSLTYSRAFAQGMANKASEAIVSVERNQGYMATNKVTGRPLDLSGQLKEALGTVAALSSELDAELSKQEGGKEQYMAVPEMGDKAFLTGG